MFAALTPRHPRLLAPQLNAAIVHIRSHKADLGPAPRMEVSLNGYEGTKVPLGPAPVPLAIQGKIYLL